jgi:hypothetical protein
VPLWFPPTDCHDIAVLLLKLALNTINPNPTTEMNRKINFSKVNLEVFLLYPMELRFVEVEGNVILLPKKLSIRVIRDKIN